MHIFITVLLLLIPFFFQKHRRCEYNSNVDVVVNDLTTSSGTLLASNDKLFEIIIIRAKLFVINISASCLVFFILLWYLLLCCFVAFITLRILCQTD